MGIGDWGLGPLGIGDWAQSPIPNPQSPIPNPHLYYNSLNIELMYTYFICLIILQFKIKFVFKNIINIIKLSLLFSKPDKI